MDDLKAICKSSPARALLVVLITACDDLMLILPASGGFSETVEDRRTQLSPRRCQELTETACRQAEAPSRWAHTCKVAVCLCSCNCIR